MKTHVQAVVIGGGVIGCSILYHLTKLGWRVRGLPRPRCCHSHQPPTPDGGC